MSICDLFPYGKKIDAKDSIHRVPTIHVWMDGWMYDIRVRRVYLYYGMTACALHSVRIFIDYMCYKLNWSKQKATGLNQAELNQTILSEHMVVNVLGYYWQTIAIKTHIHRIYFLAHNEFKRVKWMEKYWRGWRGKKRKTEWEDERETDRRSKREREKKKNTTIVLVLIGCMNFTQNKS